MKASVSLFGIIFMLVSCQAENKTNPLLSINQKNTLEILSINDKCGEWGGDEKKLIIYREEFRGQLFANYIEKSLNCEDGQELKVIKSLKAIKINDQESQLIIECLNELCSTKMANKNYPSKSGVFNSIMLSDSSIIVTDFPSVELKNFNKLVTKIMQK